MFFKILKFFLFSIFLFFNITGCDRDFSILKSEEEAALYPATTEKWSLLGLKEASISSIVIHPKKAGVIYVGTMFDTRTGEAGMILRSTNYGQNWDTLLVAGGFSKIQLNPVHPDTMYVVNGAVMKSTDGGNSWLRIMNGIQLGVESEMFSLAIDPQHPDILYAGSVGIFGGGLYKSNDGGMNWTDISPGDTMKASVGTIAIDPSNPDIIYIGTGDDGSIYKSTDGGSSWRITGWAYSGKEIRTIAIYPVNSNTLYVGIIFSGLFASGDGGDSWQRESLPDSIQGANDVAFSQTTNPDIYVATSWGCFYKDHLSSLWKEYNEGLEQRYKYIVDVELTPDGQYILAGLKEVRKDEGGIYIRKIRP